MTRGGTSLPRQNRAVRKAPGSELSGDECGAGCPVPARHLRVLVLASLLLLLFRAFRAAVHVPHAFTALLVHSVALMRSEGVV